MNKKICICITLTSLFFSKETAPGWQTSFSPTYGTAGWVLKITNKTQSKNHPQGRQVNIHAYFEACTDDHGYIDPNQTLYTYAGSCNLNRLTVDGGTGFTGPFKGYGGHYAIFEIIEGGDGRPVIKYTNTFEPY